MKATVNATGVVAVLGILAAVGLVAWVSRKGVKGAASAAATAAVEAAGDAAVGAVVGIGQAVGIPETNASECARAKAEGRTWDASFACPAGDFISYLFGPSVPKVDQSILDANDARARYAPRGTPAATDPGNNFTDPAVIGHVFP